MGDNNKEQNKEGNWKGKTEKYQSNCLPFNLKGLRLSLYKKNESIYTVTLKTTFWITLCMERRMFQITFNLTLRLCRCKAANRFMKGFQTWDLCLNNYDGTGPQCSLTFRWNARNRPRNLHHAAKIIKCLIAHSKNIQVSI